MICITLTQSWKAHHFKETLQSEVLHTKRRVPVVNRGVASAQSLRTAVKENSELTQGLSLAKGVFFDSTYGESHGDSHGLIEAHKGHGRCPYKKASAFRIPLALQVRASKYKFIVRLVAQ